MSAPDGSDDRTRLPAHQLIRVAAAAQADVRTVAKVYAGQHVRGAVADRVRQALADLKLAPGDAPQAEAAAPEKG